MDQLAESHCTAGLKWLNLNTKVPGTIGKDCEKCLRDTFVEMDRKPFYLHVKKIV